VFSNGQRDPWAAGGVVQNVTAWNQPDGSMKCVTLFIKESGHHLDLRSPNKDDPAPVTEARNVEKMYIKKWIAEYEAAKTSKF
jgi:hypothetical protein